MRPRWVLKKVVAEWHFERENTTELQFVLSLTGASREDTLSYWRESEGVPWPLLYVMVRVSKPDIVVDSGVHRGRSSFSILQALAENDQGSLYSVELGGGKKIDTYGQTYHTLADDEIGSLVPAGLRNRWHLILGDAREELPVLLSALGAIDVFFHDSLHTEEHMMFEYETAWPYLRKDGYLLSDDISFSFREFASRVNKPYICTGNIPRFGGIRK